LFVYGHFPLTLGTVLVGVGLEGLAVHPETPGPSEFAWSLAAGLALFFAGIVMIVAGTARSWRPVWPWPLVLIPIVVALGAAPVPSALLHTAAFAVVAVAAAVPGGRRISWVDPARDPAAWLPSQPVGQAWSTVDQLWSRRAVLAPAPGRTSPDARAFLAEVERQ
jgi:hypothetical protein